MNFLILHGTLGNPEANWFPWLAGELEKQGHTTLRPQLPTPDGQTPENWIKIIGESVVTLSGAGDDLVIVAHSRSPLAVCQYLQTRTSPVRACFFVAGFAKRLPDTEEPFPTLNNPFDDQGADWSKVRAACRKFVCLASDNDPYVPMPIAKSFAADLKADFIVIHDGDHLGSAFLQFPKLLDIIKSTVV